MKAIDLSFCGLWRNQKQSQLLDLRVQEFFFGFSGFNQKLSSVIVSLQVVTHQNIPFSFAQNLSRGTSIIVIFSQQVGFCSLTSFLIFAAVMIPLYHYQHKHPHNFVFLGLFTLCLSFSIGVVCANTQGLFLFFKQFDLFLVYASCSFCLTIIYLLQEKLFWRLQY